VAGVPARWELVGRRMGLRRLLALLAPVTVLPLPTRGPRSELQRELADRKATMPKPGDKVRVVAGSKGLVGKEVQVVKVFGTELDVGLGRLVASKNVEKIPKRTERKQLTSDEGLRRPAGYFKDPRKTRGRRAISCGRSIVMMEAAEHEDGNDVPLSRALRRDTVEERHLFVVVLIEAGCRYFVCGGDDPLAWEEAADEAFVMMTLNASESEVAERMVMTTAHEVESEEKVALFFVSCTNFSAHTFTDFLVLTLENDGGAEGRLCAAVRAVVSAKGIALTLGQDHDSELCGATVRRHRPTHRRDFVRVRDSLVFVCRGPVAGQQLVELAPRVILYAGKDVGEILEGICPARLAHSHERVQSLAAGTHLHSALTALERHPRATSARRTRVEVDRLALLRHGRPHGERGSCRRRSDATVDAGVLQRAGATACARAWPSGCGAGAVRHGSDHVRIGWRHGKGAHGGGGDRVPAHR
jgi:hypothetical protein